MDSILMFALGLMTTSALAAPKLIYPLAYSPEITSTFGTYRISHHHAGLDLTTGGSEAVAVRAAAAGKIYRLKRGSGGFGRAIYIEHPDGFQTVYAHLSAFNPKLQAQIRAREAKKRRFRVAFNLKKPIEVKAGEVLGYVGTSGTDLVHLHFELRKRGTPINPLKWGLPVPDTKPPQILRLKAVPFTRRAQLDGAHDAVIYPFVEGKIEQPIRISGDVRLSVEAPDHIDGSERDLSPYSIALRVDGRRWHMTRYHQVSYADMRHTELDFDAEVRAHREGLFNKLYAEGPRVRAHRKPGRRLSRLREGDHQGEIIAKDAAGHVTRASFTLRVGPPAPPCVIQRRRLKGHKTAKRSDAKRVWRGETLIVQIPDLCEGGAARVDARLDERRIRWSATRLAGEPAIALTVPADKRHPKRVVRLGYATGDGPPTWLRVDGFSVFPKAEITLKSVKLQVGEEALFFNYPSERFSAPNPGGEGLEAISPLYHFGNTWRPAQGFTKISIARPLPAGAGPHVGIYLHDRGRWWRLGGSESGRWVSASTVHLGELALMRDVWTPVVGTASVDPHPAGPRLIVPIEEHGAGLSWVSLKVDGEPKYLELQRAFDRVIWRPWTPPNGPHVIEIVAHDRAGHEVINTQTVVF